jgi:hypothetical protein
LNESEAFICKAFKGEAIVELLRALNNAAYESLRLALWVKIDEKKDHHPTCPLVPRRGRRVYHSDKMNDDMIVLKPSSIK